jgi:eukaryotic-like serine/threonine-protein kinase
LLEDARLRWRADAYNNVAASEKVQGGHRFGRYILLERIGSGGMAEVFRAVAHGMEGFQRTFVLKRIRHDHSAATDFVDMFVNEARISALLNHENIVQIYDFGEIDGCYFLTMEYLRGKDLSTVLRRLYSRKEYIDPAIAAFVGLQVARGLAYAHSLTLSGGEALNIVHRDVTPSNIMLLRAGGVKLLDFGIAKTQGKFNLAENTETGICKGKLPYLSPEQVNGNSLDRRSDVFALGVVMWESLTGRRLFLGRTDFETMQNVLERPIPPPSTLRPSVPTALDYIVVRALERDPKRRYPDARVLADELETVVQDLRYRSDAIPGLLDSLFGHEENSVQITPPHLPAVDINALNTWSSRKSTKGDKPNRALAPRNGAGVGTGVRRRRRRRFALATTAALLGLLSLLAGGLWVDASSEAASAEVEQAAVSITDRR